MKLGQILVQLMTTRTTIFCSNTGNYGPEITPYLDTLHVVIGFLNKKLSLDFCKKFAYL